MSAAVHTTHNQFIKVGILSRTHWIWLPEMNESDFQVKWADKLVVMKNLANPNLVMSSTLLFLS
ncbi:Lon proteolytic domain-containing protein [Polynucleobacter arcticus]|uniref:Uncharacterized protein n=1 Tax=Polynucleobacter arcticus TaxID=1743165 RepID=A0A6M9PKR8_9BURK|nr:hypothetical protein DN92_01835 [Polynucleobacter arcticus]